MQMADRLTGLRLPTLAGSPFASWLHVWQRSLNDCLPSRVRRWLLQRQAPTLVVSPKGEDALLSRELGGERSPMTVLEARADAELSTLVPKPRKGWKETVVELASSQVLIRTVTLPAQVKDNLRQVVGYELDRLTPFQARDVYYDVIPIETLARGSRLEARLALCRRDQADPWVERLRRLGSAPARLTWAGAWENANLLPTEQRPRQRRLGLMLNLALLILMSGLLAAVMLSPLWQKDQELEQLNRVLRGVRIQAEQVPTIREELERARAGSVAVLERKASQPRMIDLLRELTDRLPDHTWVQTINFRDDEVDIRGESDQATELLNLLEQAPGISNVSFRSPVMQVSQTGKERFHIAFRYQRV